jgi:hypothetical protein
MEVCRRAGVSRSNLYDHHPLLVEEIVGKRAAARKSGTTTARAVGSSDSVKRLKERNHALLLLYAELLQEVRLLRSRLERVQKKRRG